MTVVGGELPKLTGTEVTGSNPLQELWSWLGGLLVGEVPRGLPTLQLPEGQLLADHPSTVAIAAVALVLIGFSQTAGDARAFAARHRYRIDINQESVAQGTANVGAGLFQGMPEDESLPGVVVLRLDGGLFFATSDALEDRIREVALSAPDVGGIVLDCGGMDFIDSQGSAKLRELIELTERAGVTLRLARVKPAVRELLRRDQVLDRIGGQRIHGNIRQAVEAQIEWPGRQVGE